MAHADRHLADLAQTYIDPAEARFLVEDTLDDEPDPLESEALPASRTHRASARRRFERVKAHQALRDVLGELPVPGESVHLVSAAKFDFWTWVPTLIDYLGRADALYCSTWTLNRTTAVELFELWDAGKIKTCVFLTGLYFKRRETAVYTLLLQGIRKRNGKYRAFRNHAKVLLLDNGRDFLTVEGSANLTANPRLEQYVLTNDRQLWEFHRTWFDEMAATVPPEDE